MNIGFDHKLYTQLPNPTPVAGEVLLQVVFYVCIRPNGNNGLVYEEGKSGLQKIKNYAQVYRYMDIIRKVLSRQQVEKIRNDKWLVCGIGKDENEEWKLFVHPAAQKFQTHIAVPSFWTLPVNPLQNDQTLWNQVLDGGNIPEILHQISLEFPIISGANHAPEHFKLDALEQWIIHLIPSSKTISSVFTENILPAKSSNPSPGKGKAAVLYGYGNYARTIALPFLKPYVQLSRVHEIDSSLLIGAKNLALSTNPTVDPEDFNYPVWLIAGFHHTHAAIAIEALKNGIIPVIEKPIATTSADFEGFYAIAKSSNLPFFQCFQKRYQIFNDFTFEDLQVKKGEPIHYKATVFEIPLPMHHWYNWPASGSRIISNGCHWIDQFLFLNDYVDVAHFEVLQLNDKEILMTIHLVNGATAVITLSDIGPNRIGMREYVELSVPGRRVTITDSMYYISESSEKIIRKATTDKLHYLRLMYQQIGKKIMNGEAGDPLKSLSSTHLSLLMEEKYQSQYGTEKAF